MSFKNIDEAAGYLGAMIDGEGSVLMPSKPELNGGASVIIVNVSREVISACREAADLLGLRYRVRTRKRSRPEWQDAMVVCFSHWDDFERLLSEIPIRMPEKRRRLETLLAQRRDTRKYTKIDKEEFRHRYVDEKWSNAEMASAYKIHRVYVPGMARKLGIPSRTRTEGVRVAFSQRNLA